MIKQKEQCNNCSFFVYSKLGEYMSIKYIDDNINIYIIKEKINNINIDNEKELENY